MLLLNFGAKKLSTLWNILIYFPGYSFERILFRRDIIKLVFLKGSLFLRFYAEGSFFRNSGIKMFGMMTPRDEKNRNSPLVLNLSELRSIAISSYPPPPAPILIFTTQSYSNRSTYVALMPRQGMYVYPHNLWR